MPDPIKEFLGKQILVVEDEFFVADQLKAELEQRGAIVLGPVARVSDASALIKNFQVHGAVLDVQLDAETSYPIAEMLEQRGVPYVFVSATPSSGVPEHFQRYLLGKPATMVAIARALFTDQEG